MDASNYLHIITYAGGVPTDTVSSAPMPVDVWNRIALVVQAPQPDGTGGSVTGYLNGVTNIVSTICTCCVLHITNVLDWTMETPTVLSGLANGMASNAEFYVSSIQFHAVAMSPQMIAGIGAPNAGPAPVNQTSAGPSPVLSATLISGAVNISWTGTPYVLQEATDLTSGVWTDSALPFTESQTDGNILTTAVANPTTQAPAKFYRLVFRP